MVTQKDIAAKADVSVAMVSRVLSGKASEIGASPSTIERIEKIASSLGYRPSYAAQVLKGAPSSLIGVAVVDFDDPFFGQVIRLLQTHAGAKGFSVMLASADEAPFERFLQQPISQMILLGSTLKLDWIEDWTDKSVPIVQLGSGPEHPRLNRISIDEYAGFKLLTEHLQKNGTERILYLGPTEGVRAGRYQALTRAIELTTLRHTPNDIFETQQVTISSGAKSTAQIIPYLKKEKTALICANDQLALGALHTLHQHQLSIPKDIQVIGFDDIPMAEYSTPPLTTLRQPIENMVQALLRTKNALPSKILSFEPEMMIRETTLPA